MKLFYSLPILFISISLLIFQTNSFTTTEIGSEAILSVVSEENSVIAINYGVGKHFTVTNNTTNTLEIVEIWLCGNSNNRIIELNGKGDFIKSGGKKAFNISGGPQNLHGKGIQLIARWEDGSAVINSTIPEKNKKEIILEQNKEIQKQEEKSNIEEIEEPVVIEPVNPDVKENTIKSKVVEDLVNIVEEATSEAVEEVVDLE